MPIVISTIPERDLRDAGIPNPTPSQIADYGKRWCAAAEEIGRRYGRDIAAYADGRAWTHVLDDDEWDVDQAIWQAAHDATPARRRGRPAVGGQISVSFAPEVLAAVDDAAASEGVSRSEFIRRATRDALPPPERRARLREQA